jgi:hypothetical protein
MLFTLIFFKANLILNNIDEEADPCEDVIKDNFDNIFL